MYKGTKKRKSMKLENVIGCILWLIPAYFRGPPVTSNGELRVEGFADRIFFLSLCPQAVILCVHLWMCMKKHCGRYIRGCKAALLTKALWSTVGMKEQNPEVQTGHTNTSWVKFCSQVLVLLNISPTDPGSSLVLLGFSSARLLETHWRCVFVSNTNVFLSLMSVL